jgi:hypothetical protein
MTKPPKDDDAYSEAEAARRRDAIVRNMIATPPRPHKPTKAKRAKKAKPNEQASKKGKRQKTRY